MFDLKNRVALVTGASRGIGKAIAVALANAGAAVATNYRERDSEAAAVVEAINSGGGRAAAFRADVSLREHVQSMIHDIEERLGRIDILVNNAGMATPHRLEGRSRRFDACVRRAACAGRRDGQRHRARRSRSMAGRFFPDVAARNWLTRKLFSRQSSDRS
jgi:NAD(P)-dependent dehydrogenase (short-subunit alcohol dehydrogenase family)